MGIERTGAATAAIILFWTAGAAAQVSVPDLVVSAPSPILPRDTTASDVPIGVVPIPTEVFAPVTVVPRWQIAGTPGATLGDVLFDRPGLSGTSYAPGANRPVIRGLDNFRVRIQENGIGVGDASTIGEDHGVPIDPLVTEGIEVIRGPATLRFGSPAIGGVVEARTGRIPDRLTAPGASVILRGAGSSVDSGREGAAITTVRHGNVVLHADVFARRTEDYATPLGRQRNSAAEARGASAGGSIFFDGSFIGLSVATTEKLYGVPSVAGVASRTRIDLNQTRFASRGELRPDSTAVDAVRFWFGASSYKHNERSFEDGVDGVRAVFRNREQEGRVETQFMPLVTPFGAWTTSVGMQFGARALGTDGEAGGLLAPSDTTRVAAYVFNEGRLTDALRVQMAARIETVRVQGTATAFPPDFLPVVPDPASSPFNRRFVPASVSFGLLHTLPWDMVASATAQYVQRAPEAAELLSRGAHDATATFEIGDPNLRREAATSFEVGLRRARGPLRFDATAYHTRYDGFIFKRLTGVTCGDDFATCGVDTELSQVVYSQRDATFTGAEMLVQADLTPLGTGMLGIDAQYEFVRARFSDGTNVPRIPPQRVGAGLYWRDPSWFARVGLLHASAQNRIGAGETPTAGYDLLRAELAYTRSFDGEGGLRRITAGVVGTNLLDDVARNHISFLKNEVVMPGRGVRLFVEARF